MQVLACSSAKNGPMLLLTFSGGPLALLHITHPKLITVMYIMLNTNCMYNLYIYRLHKLVQNVYFMTRPHIETLVCGRVTMRAIL